jgi:hypothetical protein
MPTLSLLLLGTSPHPHPMSFGSRGYGTRYSSSRYFSQQSSADLGASSWAGRRSGQEGLFDLPELVQSRRGVLAQAAQPPVPAKGSDQHEAGRDATSSEYLFNGQVLKGHREGLSGRIESCATADCPFKAGWGRSPWPGQPPCEGLLPKGAHILRPTDRAHRPGLPWRLGA